MRIITVEEHFVTPAFVAGPGKASTDNFRTWRPGGGVIVDKLSDLGAGRIAEMDAAGVDVQVLSLNSPGVEQSERDAQVRLGNTEDLLRLPHRMIDLDALIPERIPQGFGNLLDVTPTLVDEQQIKVGVRAELASAVSADGDKSDLPG